MKAKNYFHSKNEFGGLNPNQKRAVDAYSLIDLLFGAAVLALVVAIVLPAFAPARHHHGSYCSNNLKQIGLSFKQWSLDNNDRYPMEVSVTNGGTMELVNNGNVWPHFAVMSNELNTPRLLVCPDDKRKSLVPATTFGSVTSSTSPPGISFNNDRSVSYFVAVDLTVQRADLNPSAWLVGDGELAVGGKPIPHGLITLSTNDAVSWPRSRLNKNAGYIGLADGSVVGLGNQIIRKSLGNTGAATTRLAMP